MYMIIILMLILRYTYRGIGKNIQHSKSLFAHSYRNDAIKLCSSRSTNMGHAIVDI